MKKYFFFALTAAMMSFAGCQEMEQEAPINPNEGGSTIEFVADIAQTKTTLDVANGYKVDWEDGDVVYMVTSDGTWGAAYGDDQDAKTIAEFTYADGKFTSDATIADGSYTFKGIYAVASQKSYHRGASSTHKLEATQAQNCANPTAHIKANDALVGTFTATVPMAEMAKMNMSHLYTLMQVNVKNATGAAIEVIKFEMTAEGADLAAVFNVDFENTAITTKSGASSTITVNVTDGNVDAGQALPVYFVMAPLSDYTGDVTFKVTDANGNTYSKTVAMTDITFEAGKYNTTPYAISTPDKVEAKGLPFVETFGSSLGEFTAQTVGALPDGLTYVWAYASGYGAKASAYVGGTRYNQTTYLVSPVLSLASVENAKMSFEHTGKYFTNMEEEAAVCVRIVGGDWEILTIPTYFSGNDWSFVNSGDIDLSDYVGKEIQIGFRYTSTSDSAGTWEIKNVKVEAEETGGDDPVEPEPDDPDGGTATLSSDEIKTKIAASKCSYGTEVTYNDADDGVIWTSTCLTDAAARPWLQMKKDASVYIAISADTDIKEVVVTVTAAQNSSGGVADITKHSSFTGTLSLNTKKDGAGEEVASGTANNNIVTLTPAGNNKTLYLKTSVGARVWNIDVKKSAGSGETPTIQPRNLQFSAATATATVGQLFTAPTLSGVTTGVEYTSSNTAVATVNAETGAVTLVGAGTTTIKASAPATAEYEAGEASYTLTVAAAVVDDTDYSGTYAIVAYRNNEALYYYLTNVETTTSTKRLTAVAAGNALPEAEVTVNGDKLWKVAKSGSTYTVQSVASSKYVAWESGNSAIMSDEGIVFNLEENEGTFHFVYTGSEKARYLSLNNQTGNDYFAMYEGTISDLYLIPATEGEEAVPELTGITVNATKTTFTVGEAFAFVGTVTANYSNGTTEDVTASATFSGYNMSQAGTQIITVAYEGKTATYDITVNPAQGGGDSGQPITVETTVKDYAAANNWVNSTKYTTLNLDSVITATAAGGGNTGKYYTSGNNWRFYQNETPTLTISAAEGYTITSVKITYAVDKTGILTRDDQHITSATSCEVNAASVTFGVGNTSPSVTNGQVRVTAIEVVYQKN